MSEIKVLLVPIKYSDKEQFILNNQEAFRYGALEEFGVRDTHFEEDDEIISRATIENAIDSPNAETYHIIHDKQIVGGVVLNILSKENKGELQLLFIIPKYHSKGIGYAAWLEVEKLHPEITIWETYTPYFETRNIHFYVNKCKFKIVEYFNQKHCMPKESNDVDNDINDNMFRFEKRLP